jgi:hypothetical protein
MAAPMQVIENQHQLLFARHCFDQGGDRLKQREALGLRIATDRLARSWELGQQPP